MRSRQLLIGLFAVSLVAMACANGPSETPVPSSAAPATLAASVPASATASSGPTTASSAPASITASAPASSAAAATAPGAATAVPPGQPSASTPACTPEPPTTASADWTTLKAHDGDFQFAFPSTWDKLYGAFVFNTSSLVDPQTFAETGLQGTSETRADLVRAPGVGLPNASVLIVPGVTSNTATIFARQVSRFAAIPTIAVISTTDTACIGGEVALGIRFTFNNPLPASPGASPTPSANRAVTYQESWYMVRSGRLYDFQWLAAAPPRDTDTAIFREMFRTWQWSANVPVATPQPTIAGQPSASVAASAGASSFILAGMATTVDTAAQSANPKDFVTTVPRQTTVLFAVFSLKPGLSGQINGALKQGDKVLVTLSLQYGPKNTWGDFRINTTNGITPGNYTMVITFVPSGETINLPFAVK